MEEIIVWMRDPWDNNPVEYANIRALTIEHWNRINEVFVWNYDTPQTLLSCAIQNHHLRYVSWLINEFEELDINIPHELPPIVCSIVQMQESVWYDPDPFIFITLINDKRFDFMQNLTCGFDFLNADIEQMIAAFRPRDMTELRTQLGTITQTKIFQDHKILLEGYMKNPIGVCRRQRFRYGLLDDDALLSAGVFALASLIDNQFLRIK